VQRRRGRRGGRDEGGRRRKGGGRGRGERRKGEGRGRGRGGKEGEGIEEGSSCNLAWPASLNGKHMHAHPHTPPPPPTPHTLTALLFRSTSLLDFLRVSTLASISSAEGEGREEGATPLTSKNNVIRTSHEPFGETNNYTQALKEATIRIVSVLYWILHS
jgi:hypothetical protein